MFINKLWQKIIFAKIGKFTPIQEQGPPLTTHTVVFLVSHGDAAQCSMYDNFGINNFEATIRKSSFGFIQRLAKSTNSLIVTIEKSWIVRIDIWNFWLKTLYIASAT